MAESSLQDRYVDLLLDRVRKENFPNPDHLDRIEQSIRTPEQLRDYIETLLERVEGLNHPSSAMLDRIQALAEEEQKAQRRANRAGSDEG